MKKIRVLLLMVLSLIVLATLPNWLPSPPVGGWSKVWPWFLADPQRAFVLAAGCLALLMAAWLFVLTGLILSAATDPSGRAVRRTIDWLTPRFARGLVRAVLGVAVAVGPAAPALAAGSLSSPMATSAPSLSPVPAPIVAAPEVPPLLALDRPGVVVATQAPANSAPPRPQHPKPTPTATTVPTLPSLPTLPAPATHTVQPGDTLWALAAAQLPAGSSPALITRDWQHWYEVNRAAIGADPDLLLAGERLVIPQATP